MISATTLADQAQAEHSSGAVRADTWDHGWLEGVEAALRWIAGGGTTSELRDLIDRAESVTA